MFSHRLVSLQQIRAPLRAAIRNAFPQLSGLSRYWRAQVLGRPTPMDAWLIAKGDTTLRVSYPLTAESVVFDVGGFRGTWSQQILDRYSCHINIFEPVRSYWSSIGRRFQGCPTVTVHPYGLSDKATTAPIAIREDASTVFVKGPEPTEAIQLCDISEVFNQLGLSHIELIKINIEGGEYDLLPRMIQMGITDVCRDIQVQFHSWVPDAAARRHEIQQSLSRTHRLTYEYPFIWENWELR